MSDSIVDPGTLRGSQIITTFGPGSIYDIQEDSFLIMGLDFWKAENFKNLKGETIISYMKKDGDSFKNLEFIRIPERTKVKEKCKNENCDSVIADTPKKLEPVRLVSVCEDGHLDEFPWYDWAHQEKTQGVTCEPKSSTLKLVKTGKTSGLESHEVSCSCGDHENLGKAIGEYYSLGPCRGKTPWIDNEEHGCKKFPIGMYKGSTSLYYSKIVRSITIPPFSGDSAREVVAELETPRKPIPTNASKREENIKAYQTLLSNIDPNLIAKVVSRWYEINSGDEKSGREDEFAELNVKTDPNITDDFIVEPAGVPERFRNSGIENIVKVKKLREVMVLTGFYRAKPFEFGKDDQRKPQFLGSILEKKWLPASVNSGEGIFLSFDVDRIHEWEKRDGVASRFDNIMNAQKKVIVDKISISPRFILLHSISHMIMKELSEYSGYSQTSVRERIYSSDNMAGILIYTSSQSSDGSMGGLVEQGDRETFNVILQRALIKTKLCSSDPYCSSSKNMNPNFNNGSCCHSCLFSPEPSCECMNNFLDRSMILPTLHERNCGFFER